MSFRVMSIRGVCLCLLALLVARVAASAAQAAEPSGVIFDGYRCGVHDCELSVEGAGPSATYQLKRKDLANNLWGQPIAASAAALRGREDFQLLGSIAGFPAALADLSAIDWSGLQAVGWPDADSIYVRHRELTEKVDGRPTTAFRWTLKDASQPMDLVIGPDNAVLAAIDVRRDYVIVRRGYEDFTTLKQWRDPSMSQPRYGYRELDLVMMPTTAGPRLATRVYLPRGDIQGPFPTIFVRTPYGISELFDKYFHYATRGFAVVLQAVRGTSYRDPGSRSEGQWEDTVQEPGDGADALAWIVAQPWCNGKIGMQGGSYVGFTQFAASIANHPALKCLVPEVCLGTAFSDQPYMGGTFVSGLAYYTFWMLDKPLLPGRKWTDVFRHRPLIDMDVYATGEDLPLWNNFIKHYRNDEFWKGQNWFQGDHERTFGTFQISGWFDDDYPGTRSNWALMAKHGSRPNRLLLGPWKHRYNADRALNGFSFGLDALRDDVWLIKQQWYDYFLKDIENGVTDPKVEYFVLGENTWQTADAWPPREVTPQPWYFHSTGQAHLHPADGRLTRQAPATSEPPEKYIYDPRSPVQNWYSFDLMERWADMQSFPYDFKDTETRDDLATYTTAPLETDVTIAGNIIVVLYASTDVKDTDWWVYLSDVNPANESNRLTVGALRARFRNLADPTYHVFGSNFEKEELLSGDLTDVVRYEISIPSIANTFKKGHRIRIAVMNAHDNYSFPNSNTGGDEGLVTKTVPGKMHIHHSPDHPSHVILPMMPAAR